MSSANAMKLRRATSPLPGMLSQDSTVKPPAPRPPAPVESLGDESEHRAGDGSGLEVGGHVGVVASNSPVTSLTW